MERQIIIIDEGKCNGCGICVNACHEGALAMVDGKARLVREDFCDGFGDCLPKCPVDAISFVTRDALPYDEEAVKEDQRKAHMPMIGLDPLCQWPIKIRLVPMKSKFFNGELIIGADCVGYVSDGIREGIAKGKGVLIGCPKLDGVDHSVKLREILMENDITKVTVMRMEVPCCSGMTRMAEKAITGSGKDIGLEEVVYSVNGKVKDKGIGMGPMTIS